MDIKCDNCGKIFSKKPSQIHKTNFCSTKCMSEYRKKHYLGENNPNKKYIFDENLLENIDCEFKAWLLGWIASDGSLKENSISIEINKKDIDVLEKIRNVICTELPLHFRKNDLVSLTINSNRIVEDVKKHLKINIGGKRCEKLTDVDIDSNYINAFIRGVFEGDGYIRTESSPYVTIVSKSKVFLSFISSQFDISFNLDQDRECYVLSYTGTNALDFLEKIYGVCNFKMNRKYESYLEIANWQPIIRGKGNSTRIDNIYVAKTDKKAVLPFKKRASDSGYDLTAISIYKKVGEVTFYDTGIKVCPPFGYYFDVVPRSSLSKTGYILANSVGIIDRNYRGSIKVPLIKIDKNMPDLEIPSRIVQMIPRKINHLEVVQVKDFTDETERGSQGFGSSGKF